MTKALAFSFRDGDSAMIDSTAAAVRQFFEAIESMGLVTTLGGLGVTAIILASLKWFIDRRRWRQFKASVHEWLDRLIKAERFPKNLQDYEWKAECERMLMDARFRPAEIVQLLDLSTIVAKGIAANKMFM